MINAPAKGISIFTATMLIVSFIFSNPSFCLTSDIDWKEIKGDHFILYFTEDKDFDKAKDILDKAEVYYRRIATELGYPRYSEFWTWDNRVKIYIYPTRELYLKATEQPSWSYGMADYRKKIIASYTGSQEFIDSILPHEMAHLIFRDFVGFRGEVPLWLDEGVAQWEEELKRQPIKGIVRDLYLGDQLLSLSDLMSLDIRHIDADKKVYMRQIRGRDGQKGVLILNGENLVKTYYIQSVSVVGFLIEKYGSISFAAFCRQLRDGKSLEEALRFAYPTIHGTDELEDRWKEYLKEGV